MISERLSSIMRRRGISQLELSRMCGISQPTISRLLSGETDERSLRVSTLAAIHDALRCTWVELLGTDYVR